MSLRGLLNQTITLYSKSGYNAYGRETVGSGTNYQCRFQKTTKTILLPTGQTIQLVAIVYLAGEPTVAINDKVTYSDHDYKVAGIYTATDGQGNTNNTRLQLVEWLAT